MNATSLRPYRADRALTFKAWRNSRPVNDVPELAECSCIEDAAAVLAPLSAKGMVLEILMMDAGKNRSVVAFYKVRESSKRYSWRPSTNGGSPVRVGALEPLLLHALDVHEFAPVEPFDAFKSDPVGRDLQLIETKGAL